MTKRSTYGAIALAFGAAITVTLSGCNVPVLSQTTKTYDEARAAQTSALKPKVDGSSLKNQGYLTVGLRTARSTIPFYLAADSGEISGIDVDVASILASELGLKVRFVSVASTSKGLESDCDIVMDTASNSDVSGARIVGTYAEQSTAFFHKGASGAVSAADLNGKTVGLQGGSVSQKALGDSGLTMTQKTFDSLNDCFDALAAGSVDYVLCDAYAGAYLARMYNGLAFAGTIDVPQTAGVAVASTNSTLLKALGEAMGAAQMGGCLDIVRSHWIGDLPVLTAAEQVKDVPKSVSAATADDSSGGGLTVGGNAAAPPA